MKLIYKCISLVVAVYFYFFFFVFCGNTCFPVRMHWIANLHKTRNSFQWKAFQPLYYSARKREINIYQWKCYNIETVNGREMAVYEHMGCGVEQAQHIRLFSTWRCPPSDGKGECREQERQRAVVSEAIGCSNYYNFPFFCSILYSYPSICMVHAHSVWKQQCWY